MSDKNQISFTKIRSVIFLLMIVVLLAGLFFLVRPFFSAIFWAAIIAILVYPLHKKLTKYIDAPSVSAIISLIMVIVLIFIPLTLLAFLLVQQSVVLYNSFSTENIITNVQGVTSWFEKTPLGPYIIEVSQQWTTYAATAAKSVSLFLFQNIRSITQNSVSFVFTVFIMFYTLYFFFKDGEKMVERISYLSPIGEKYEKMLYEKFRTTAISTIKTTFVIGGIQGALGAVLFFAVGIEGAFIWGVIMAALSIIPALGSFIIWLPAAIIMFALGNIWQGILILIIGIFVISIIDNLLRPVLVGKGTEMHPLIVLFSTLGGLFIFGISGFVIGPIIAAMFFAAISIYSHYFRSELESN